MAGLSETNGFGKKRIMIVDHNEEVRKQVYRIFLANMDDMNLRVEEFGNGGDDFIQKPIHEELMKLKIRRQLYIAQLEQENRILQLKLQSLRNRIDRVFDEVF